MIDIIRPIGCGNILHDNRARKIFRIKNQCPSN